MNALSAATLVFLLAVLSVSGETYPEDIERLDIEALLNDKEKVNRFNTCLQDNASCTELSAKLYAILVDALKTSCSKCSEKVRTDVKTGAKFFIANHPEIWEKIMQSADPDGTKAEEINKFVQSS